MADKEKQKKKKDEKSKGKKEKKTGKGKFAAEVFVNKTPAGQKKDMTAPMADSYQPQAVEAAWDTWWEKQGYCTADAKSDADPFVIVIPPPNVTGSLHLGHALTVSIEDALVRWNRMHGKKTLWIPGFDHAGIATQVVVEKKIMKERGLTRHDLGRENFLKEVWAWKEERGATIGQQLRRVGASVDWSRSAFTMDDARSRAVKHAFIQMFNKGLIYRSNRLVNWSCSLKTAISKIEVNYLDLTGSTMLSVPEYPKDKKFEFGVIHDFSYRVKDHPEQTLVVSTTRIETMLGDVAVAVHPDDKRYQHLIGKELIHPFVPERKVIIIADPVLVDMNFGTGAVKVTPAHDPNDFACGRRNNLPQINIFDDEGRLNENAGKYKGMKRFDVREMIIKDLDALGLYHGKKNNPMSLGLCSRSKDIIEPVIRPQWWVRCQGIADRSCEAVRSKELKIHPEQFEKNWFHWLEDAEDWCISRQLWWGHRIPAFWLDIDAKTAGLSAADLLSFEIADDKDEVKIDPRWIIADDDNEALSLAAARFPQLKKDQLKLRQDPDVLDTWFSSGIFPFSVFNWPEKSEDLNSFYPTTLLETGHDILFFWVARMVMMAYALTDRLPFEHVYLHAMVRDRIGRKMSKSLGNVIDPLDVINGVTLGVLQEKLTQGNLDPNEVKRAQDNQATEYPNGISECGADALRFGLLSYTTQARDINLDTLRVVGYRQFCNKLWNATRFGLLNLGDNFKPPAGAADATYQGLGRNFADKWILSRLATAVQECDTAFKGYDFASVTTTLYRFWKDELCSIYLELSKPVYRDCAADSAEVKSAQATLFTAFHFGLRLLHPLMPFVSEELFHRLPGAINGKCPSVMTSTYPSPVQTPAVMKWRNEEVEAAMNLANEISNASRSLRNSFGITADKLPTYVVCSSAAAYEVTSKYATEIKTMAKASEVTALRDEQKLPDKCVSQVVNAECVLFLSMKGAVDPVAQLLKLDSQMVDLGKAVKEYQEKTSSPNFSKAPENVQKTLKDKLQSLEEEKKLCSDSITMMKSLIDPSELAAVERTLFEARINRLITKSQSLMAKEVERLEKGKEKLAAAQEKNAAEKKIKTLQEAVDKSEEEIKRQKERIAKFEARLKGDVPSGAASGAATGASAGGASGNSDMSAAEFAEYKNRADMADKLIAKLTERLTKLETLLKERRSRGAAAADEQKTGKVKGKDKAAKEAKKDTKKDAKKEEKKEDKKKKPPRVKIAKSDVYIEVRPDTEVEDFSWENIEKDIRAMRINGLLWAQAPFALIDFVFGLKKMLVVAQIVDNMVESTAPIVEAINKLKGVSDSEMVSIQTANDDWDPTNTLSMVAGTANQSKGGDKKDSKKGGDSKKKDKKSKKKEEGPRVVTDAMIKQSAQKVIVAAKEADYYVAGVTECDGSGQTDISKENFLAVDKVVREKVPDCVIMYIGAGNTSVTALVSVPASKKTAIDAREFLNSTMVSADEKQSDATVAYGEYKCDAEKGDFAIKIKDQVNGMAFQYLRSNKLLVESDDDEEDYFLSDL